MLKPKSTHNVLGPSRVQTRPFYYENQSNKQTIFKSTNSAISLRKSINQTNKTRYIKSIHHIIIAKSKSKSIPVRPTTQSAQECSCWSKNRKAIGRYDRSEFFFFQTLLYLWNSISIVVKSIEKVNTKKQK